MTSEFGQPTMVPFGEERLKRSSDWVLIAVIPVILLATVVALFKPAWALRIALICAILAACAAAAWWLISMISRTTPERRSIDTKRPDPAASAAALAKAPVPLAVSELQHPIGVAGLSSQGLRYLQFVATERLWANHRLNLAYTPHHPLIQARVSPSLWQVLGGQAYYNQLPLGLLLQEIERL